MIIETLAVEQSVGTIHEALCRYNFPAGMQGAAETGEVK